MSKYDLIDMFEAYASKATYTDRNMSTHQMVAMSDIEKIIDDLITKLGNGKNYISSNS